ncbi:MAG: nuclear transport factor 2 family protein [Thermoleophilaceae bacterium]|nr:nuclear transport factor 2 family protein [Thermoleophilaceae bacterium]
MFQHPSGVDLARRFVEVLNGHDGDAFEALLDPQVVLHTGRGPKHGRAAARAWLGGPGENLTSSIQIDCWESSDTKVLAGGTRFWRWVENGEVAEEHPYAAVWWLRNGLIIEWRAYDSIDAARVDFDSGS